MQKSGCKRIQKQAQYTSADDMDERESYRVCEWMCAAFFFIFFIFWISSLWTRHRFETAVLTDISAKRHEFVDDDRIYSFTFSVARPQRWIEAKRSERRTAQLSQSPINEMRLCDCDKCIHSIFGSNIGKQHF